MTGGPPSGGNHSPQLFPALLPSDAAFVAPFHSFTILTFTMLSVLQVLTERIYPGLPLLLPVNSIVFP